MSIIHNERLDYKDYYNGDIVESKQKDSYTYDLNVVKEYSYRSQSVDINLDVGCTEKYIGVEMELVKYLRIFGVLKNSEGNIVEDTKIVLFKTELINYKTEYIPVCQMITNYQGEYQAIIDNGHEDNHYTVKVQ